MIDFDGYRKGVVIVLANDDNQVLWCKRIGQDAWQFPQGGMNPDETPEEAMLRELDEETGLQPHHVDVIARTRDWHRYDLPQEFVRKNQTPKCIGQKQIWFLLRFRGLASDIKLDAHVTPEFDDWCWTEISKPAGDVVFFKQPVYEKALNELQRSL